MVEAKVTLLYNLLYAFDNAFVFIFIHMLARRSANNAVF